MWYHTLFIIAMIALFFLLLLIIHLGKQFALKTSTADIKEPQAGAGLVEGAIFTILGLLIAFTFYGAAQRFDIRREMLINEANAIGTAWLRLDLLSAKAQTEIRPLFKQYIQARVDTNHKLPDITAAKQKIEIANQLQTMIWNKTIQTLDQSSSASAGIIVIPALNNMFDIAISHNISLITHPPNLIYITLIILLCSSAFFIGYSLSSVKRMHWLHGVGYSFVMIVVLYVIIDYEFPRAGFVSIKKFDRPMIELNQKIQSYQAQ